MALKKDKEKVIDPVWGEERIKEFLDLEAPAGHDTEHHRLLKAYQSMRAEDFDTFVKFFVEAGGNVSAQNNEGKTLKEVIAEHHYSGDYMQSLEKYS